MRKIGISLLFGILCSVSAMQAYGSHVAGCDLSYTCIGGNDYMITLTFYRDCSGIDEPATVGVSFSSACGSFTATLNKLPPVNGIEVTPVCPGQITTCGGGSLYGLEKFVYQGQVTLVPCANWVISYTLCCRNTSNTISAPQSANIYIQATLNNLVAPCNSSPTFSNPPSTIICNGQQFCFNHGAIDPDGDSLVYSMVTPFDGGPGSPTPYVTYIGGYTAQQPLPSSPPVVIDPLTGDICMTPTANITTVFAVLVQEWRKINGVATLIGSVLRDMQLTVVTCTNSVPSLAGINDTSTSYNSADTNYLLPVCLGDTVAFNVYPYDADNPPDNLTLTWNNGIPDGTWTVTNNNTPNAFGTFFWVPTSGYISNTPYCFTVTIEDDNCPYVGLQAYSYCIIIKGIEVLLDPVGDTLLCMGENYTLQAHGDTNAVNFYWEIDGVSVTPTNDTTLDLTSASLGVGTHVIQVIVDDSTMISCPGSDYITITVVDQPDVNIGPDQTICNGQSITLDAGPGTLFSWIPTSEFTQTINTGVEGTYIVTVDGGNGTRCVDSDTMTLTVFDIPIVDLGPDLCIDSAITLDAGNPGFYYSWSPSGTDQTYFVTSSGTYSVVVSEDPTMSMCTGEDEVTINIIPVPIFDIGPDSTICQHQYKKYVVNGIPEADLQKYTYNWFVDILPWESSDPYAVIANMPPGNYTISCIVTGCDLYIDTASLEVVMCDITVPNIFTPNNDGHNDVFGISDISYFPNSTLVIYNRWGRKVFDSGSYDCDQQPDGTVSGTNCWDGEKDSDGVYYYVLNVNYGDTGNGVKTMEYHGTVTLMR